MSDDRQFCSFTVKIVSHLMRFGKSYVREKGVPIDFITENCKIKYYLKK